jgi:hypothetical protein
MLLLIVLFAFIFVIVLEYPTLVSGYPSGFDGYVHAASAYLVAKGGLAASPASPFYPPFFALFVALVYQLTGINPLHLIMPVGLVAYFLCVPPMYYITKKISLDNTMGLYAAFITAINPIALYLVIMGTIPNLLGFLGLLLFLSVLISDYRAKPVGIILMSLFEIFIFYVHLLVSGFLVFLFLLVFVYEVLLKKGTRYFMPFFVSLLISVPVAAIYYLPRISLFYLGTLGGVDYLVWTLVNDIALPIICLPAIFIFRANMRKKFIPAGQQHLALLKLWYLSPPIITVLFIWQASISNRMWDFAAYPAIVVLAMIIPMKLKAMKKTREKRTVTIAAAAILITSFCFSYVVGATLISDFQNATPQKIQLSNWIMTNTSPDARFCTEEEYLTTHLGWFISGTTGRIAYESMQNFVAAFELGIDVANNLQLANNITALQAGSAYWIQALRALNVTYVVLLTDNPHPNYASISNDTVFANTAYVVYNVTTYTLTP